MRSFERDKHLSMALLVGWLCVWIVALSFPLPSFSQELGKTYDFNFDGKPDGWEYYEGDRIIRLDRDTDFDGKVDYIEYYRYERDQLVRVEIDSNGDGVIDWWKYYENERLVREERDSNLDGKLDEWSFYETGLLARLEKDKDGDGDVDEKFFYIYQGRMLARVEEDLNADGHIDGWVFYEKNIKVSHEKDTSGDGKPDLFEYYRQGKVAWLRKDTDGDGKPDEWIYPDPLTKMISLRERVLAGEDFATLAKIYSEDRYAQQGGEVEIQRGTLPNRGLENLIFQMNQGDLNDVILTQEGFYLIEMLEIDGSRVKVRWIFVTRPKTN